MNDPAGALLIKGDQQLTGIAQPPSQFRLACTVISQQM